MKFLFFSLILLLTSTGFKEAQLKYNRVRDAKATKHELLKKEFKEKNIPFPPDDILFVAYKEEKAFQVWVKPTKEDKYTFFKSYGICALSGDLGPKRRQGDGQIPEGFYHINVFNPVSSFHLSLGINYPNKSDKILSKAKDKGNNIFIHGDCVTIGCIPLTDDKIKEVYWLATLAKDNGQSRIPVHIYPFKMDFEKYESAIIEHKDNIELIHFWKNIMPAYNDFKANKKPIIFHIDREGKYIFQKTEN